MQRPANHIFSHCKVIFCVILMIFGRNVALYVIFVFAKWLEAALNIFAVIWKKEFWRDASDSRQLAWNQV